MTITNSGICVSFRAGNDLSHHPMVETIIEDLKRAAGMSTHAKANYFNDLAIGLEGAYESMKPAEQYSFTFITDGAAGNFATVKRLLQVRPPQASLLFVMIGDLGATNELLLRHLRGPEIDFVIVDISGSSNSIAQQIISSLQGRRDN